MRRADPLRLGGSAGVPRRAVLALLLLAGCAPDRFDVGPVPTADLPTREYQPRFAALESPAVAFSAIDATRNAVLTEQGVLIVTDLTRFVARLPHLLTSTPLESPRDLDATNGQDLYVADGSRVLRFSDEGRLVQTLPIPSVNRPAVAVAPTASVGEAVAVAAGAEGRVYVAEATRNVVQVWRDGALVDVIGGIGQPTALDTNGRILVVGDESGRVHVVDRDGLPLHAWSHPALPSLISVSLAGETLVALAPGAVVLFSLDGERSRVIPIGGGTRLLDATIQGGLLRLLTDRAVHTLGEAEGP